MYAGRESDPPGPAGGILVPQQDVTRVTVIARSAMEVLAVDYSDEARARAYRQLLQFISTAEHSRSAASPHA
jgi:hypothetical protein